MNYIALHFTCHKKRNLKMCLINKKIITYTIETVSFEIHVIYIYFTYEIFKIFRNKIFYMLFIE